MQKICNIRYLFIWPEFQKVIMIVQKQEVIIRQKTYVIVVKTTYFYNLNYTNFFSKNEPQDNFQVIALLGLRLSDDIE